MSLRLFIYYCALCGGWAALGAWIVGRHWAPDPAASDLLSAAVRGWWLGFFVGGALGALDAWWNWTWRRWQRVLLQAGIALAVGALSGLAGGFLGQMLYNLWLPGYLLGWLLTGALVGTALALFELARAYATQEELNSTYRKLLKCASGGALGGFLGGLLSLGLLLLCGQVFQDRDPTQLWSPTAIGFVALGMCLGLFIGLAQVWFTQAWLRVEEGFRAGREILVTRETTTLGRAESCDVGLFGDPSVDKCHARILLVAGRYYIEDNNSSGGTWVNGQRIQGREPLRWGDRIQLGKSVLRFYQRHKRRAA
jgi:hypothetical protein